MLEDTIKQIINTWNVMTIKVQVNVLFIWMQTIYIVGQWVNIFHMIDLNGWISIGENSSGYILELDFKYLDKLHQLHNDYRLISKKRKINHMFSNYCITY